MTFTLSNEIALGAAPRPVFTFSGRAPLDFFKRIARPRGIPAPPIEETNSPSTAVYEPAKELKMWQPRNGVVSHVQTCWAASQTAEARVQVEAVAEEDMLEALMTLDLTIPAHYTREIMVKGHVLSVEKWTPTILDPEGFLDLED